MIPSPVIFSAGMENPRSRWAVSPASTVAPQFAGVPADVFFKGQGSAVMTNAEAVLPQLSMLLAGKPEVAVLDITDDGIICQIQSQVYQIRQYSYHYGYHEGGRTVAGREVCSLPNYPKSEGAISVEDITEGDVLKGESRLLFNAIWDRLQPIMDQAQEVYGRLSSLRTAPLEFNPWDAAFQPDNASYTLACALGSMKAQYHWSGQPDGTGSSLTTTTLDGRRVTITQTGTGTTDWPVYTCQVDDALPITLDLGVRATNNIRLLHQDIVDAREIAQWLDTNYPEAKPATATLTRTSRQGLQYQISMGGQGPYELTISPGADSMDSYILRQPTGLLCWTQNRRTGRVAGFRLSSDGPEIRNPLLVRQFRERVAGPVTAAVQEAKWARTLAGARAVLTRYWWAV